MKIYGLIQQYTADDVWSEVAHVLTRPTTPSLAVACGRTIEPGERRRYPDLDELGTTVRLCGSCRRVIQSDARFLALVEGAK